MLNTHYKFGEFELDSGRFELRRDGQALKVERIPLELLILLAEKQGDVVSRQEIIDRLWGKDVFVDTEHGINTAIRKIRQTLRDDPDRPRFVQTVTGKGYRFVGRSPSAVLTDTLVPDSLKLDVSPPPASTTLSFPGHDSKPPFWKSPVVPVVTAVLIIAAVAVAIFFYRPGRISRPTAPGPGHVMLAVLPFENLIGDPSQEYLTDGLTEEMISQLGALSPEQLGVISRTTSMVYKHTTKDARQIGNEIGVEYILEGSVRRDGDQVRITVQLIRAHDQVHIWAQSYDRQIGGSIALQKEVAQAIAEQIEVKLSPEYAKRPVQSSPDQAANEAYLRGRFFYNQFTAEGYRQAINYFQQAIDRNPNFAEAYSGISDCYHFLIVTDTIAPSEGVPRIVASAQRAVTLGDSLAESHNSMGGAMIQQYQWAAAEKELQRALALNPSYSSLHRIYAALLVTELRHKEALDQINEAMRTDPLSLPNNAEVVRTLYYARDYDGALLQAQKAMQFNPNYYRTHFWMARVYAQKHMYREAIAEDEIVLKANPDSNMALTEMAYSLAASGREAEARQILRKLEQRAASSFVPAYNLAVIHLALRENSGALKWLERSYDEGDWALMVLAGEPRLDPLRNSPRFQELVRKVGLPR